MRVLLAEDNLTNEKVACQLLAKLGHTSVTATNGSEVLEVIAQDQAFDCILMDLAMPIMDGIEATKRLIEAIPDASARPPIIAVTANAFESDRDRCLAAGMVDFLAKPLRMTTLRDALENLGRSGAAPAATVESPGEIDFEHFNSIIDGGEEEAVEIFNDFCLGVPEQIASMEGFARTGDADGFAAMAHQIKGSCATFGLVAFSNRMGDLEDLGASGRLSELADEWARNALDAFASIEAKLRACL